MLRSWIPAALVSLPLVSLPPEGAAAVDEGSWTTDGAVGVNEVVYTVDLTCPNPGFVCDLIDGYSEQDTSSVTGGGTVQVDDVLDQLRFDSDSTQDVGSGSQPAYTTLTGTDLVFPNIPFAGVPEITDVLVFALGNPWIALPGLDLTVPGDLEFLLGPNIVVPPDDIVVSGTFRALGDVGGSLGYELRDVTATFTLQNLTTIGGEPVTVDVTADMTLNLSGEVGLPAVPALPPWGLPLLAVLLATAAPLAGRRRRIDA